ncbi:unnamed protein product [Cuscuta europaea]|uniref:DUF569 domain-containing protein n=1 Tax=Cuscuta europaea TaxID=41803 RepID=A0A9P1E6G9_CUSEU|nr:unnamed protein product [Cuscuta europaea]
MMGRKVLQTAPKKLDSKIEWEPVREGNLVKMKTRYINFLRANSGIPPWRNSITHDIPHMHQDWILWQVEILEIRPVQTRRKRSLDHMTPTMTCPTLGLPHHLFPNFRRGESVDGSEGRVIYYYVANDKGNVEDNGVEWPCFYFKGNGLEELSEKLEEETGLEDVIVCMRNPLNGKVISLHLILSPNNSTMHVVVLLSSSKAARVFLPESSFSPSHC